MESDKTIEISTGTIFRAVLILLGVWFFYVIRDIVALFFVAVILSSALDPAVSWLKKKKIPRSVGVLLIYVLLLLIATALIYLIIPALLSQFNLLINDLPIYIDKIDAIFTGFRDFSLSKGIQLNGDNFSQNFEANALNQIDGIFSTTYGIFQGIFSLLVILSLTFYMSVIEDGMKKFFLSVTPNKHSEYVISLSERIQSKIGRWMTGQLFLMVIIFALYFVVLHLLGVPYALILAILGGVLEIVPYLGPIVSTIPAVIIGFLVSPLTGLAVLVAYTVIQQFENHVIVPQVMRKAIGLNPLAVVLALLVGVKVGGMLGVILAVPIVATVSVFVKDILEKEEARKKVDLEEEKNDSNE